MSLSQVKVLRNCKIIELPLEMNAPEESNLAQSNSNASDTNDSSDISSQLSEMKENYERKINELHLGFSQLKDLMMAVIDKTNNDSQPSSSQGPSKPPQPGRDKQDPASSLPGCVLVMSSSINIEGSFSCLLKNFSVHVSFSLFLKKFLEVQDDSHILKFLFYKFNPSSGKHLSSDFDSNLYLCEKMFNQLELSTLSILVHSGPFIPYSVGSCIYIALLGFSLLK